MPRRPAAKSAAASPRVAPLLCAAALAWVAAPGFSQGCRVADAAPAAADPIVTRTFTDADGDHRFGLYVPPGPAPAGGWPVVLFLHGAAERGTDGVAPTRVGLGAVVRARVADGRGFPAVAVFPQVEDPDGRILTAWQPTEPDGARALAILESVEAALPTDPARRLLTGWSMGAYGVAAQLAADPARWAAAVEVAGARTPDVPPEAIAAATATTPLWMVGGAKDRYVPFARTATLAGQDPGGGRDRDPHPRGGPRARRVEERVLLEHVLRPDRRPDLPAGEPPHRPGGRRSPGPRPGGRPRPVRAGAWK